MHYHNFSILYKHPGVAEGAKEICLSPVVYICARDEEFCTRVVCMYIHKLHTHYISTCEATHHLGNLMVKVRKQTRESGTQILKM